MKRIFEYLSKNLTFKKKVRFAFSKLMESNQLSMTEPAIEFIETEYNGKKTIDTKLIMEIIYDNELWSNFSQEDKEKILSCAFERRSLLDLNRYSIKKIYHNEYNSYTIQIADITVKNGFIYIDVKELIGSNPKNILANISSKDLMQVYYFYYLLENNEKNFSFKKEKQNKLSCRLKVINSKD